MLSSKPFKLLYMFSLAFCITQSMAAKPTPQLFYQKTTPPTVKARMEQFSRQLLGIPYLWGAQGEGDQGRYDQSPLDRMDAFDCVTYVDTVLALALANDPQGFQQCLRKIRYKNGHIDYFYRNHFTDLDWNINNQKQGYLKDITQDIMDEHHHSKALMASAVINKPAWYQHKPQSDIKLKINDPIEQAKRLAELKTRGKAQRIATVNIPYLPFSALFNAQGNPNHYLFAQIPDGAIIEIIRPNWDLTATAGTHLNVSHLGFAFRVNQELMFRNASSLAGRVIETRLIDYLQSQLKSPTVKGINVHIVIPQKPLRKGC